MRPRADRVQGSRSQDGAHLAFHSPTACCGLNGSPPQNSYVGAQYPRRWYWKVARSWGGSPYKKTQGRDGLSLSALRGHSEETAVCRLGGVSPRASHAGTSLRTLRKKCLLWKPPRQGYFCYGGGQPHAEQCISEMPRSGSIVQNVCLEGEEREGGQCVDWCNPWSQRSGRQS